MFMVKKVLHYVKEKKMLQQGDSVILGVSGGADSLCMLVILYELSKIIDMKLTVVHVNHHIRGKEADADQDFVEKFCETIGVKCVVYHINMAKLASDMKCSEEEAGRIARYKIFEKVLIEEKGNKIAIAHNLNDNCETILFNLFRGTGIKGLSGIRELRENIIRPMMCLTRAEIEAYLNTHDIAFRTDSTNLQDDYTRNRIRHHVVPYIEENINKNVAINIVRAGQDLSDIENYLDMETEKQFCKYVIINGECYLIKDEVLSCHSVIQKRIIRSIINRLSGKLKDITRSHVESVLELFEKSTGKKISLPYQIVAKRDYNGVIITVSSKKDKDSEHYLSEEVIYKEGKVYLNEYVTVRLENSKSFKQNVPELVYTKWIDCDKIKNGLVVRKRQSGDYLSIDNHGNTKKLKDYFINEKIPNDQRDDILLVADGSHIVWVIGYRMSSNYKITESTKNVMLLSYNESRRCSNKIQIKRK